MIRFGRSDKAEGEGEKIDILKYRENERERNEIEQEGGKSR